MIHKSQFIKDLRDKDSVSSPFLVKYSALSVGKTGRPFLNLILQDKTGEIEAKVWDDVNKYAGHAIRDAFLKIEGRCQLFQGRRQIVVKTLQALREDEVEVREYIMESKLDGDKLYDQIRKFIDSMKDVHYKALAEAVLLEDEDVMERLKRAPAAKTVHHAYRGGLIEHIVSVTTILDFLADHYAPYVDRDLMFLGGFFHDICKIYELSYDGVTDYTDEGKLIGHLVMGIELMDRKARELESQPGRLPSDVFPKDKLMLLKHVLLAHHGEYEYGSPKRPKCLEALIVHYADDLDSKVNSIRLFIEGDESLGRWTGLSKQFNRFFFKPDWAMKD